MRSIRLLKSLRRFVCDWPAGFNALKRTPQLVDFSRALPLRSLSSLYPDFVQRSIAQWYNPGNKQWLFPVTVQSKDFDPRHRWQAPAAALSLDP
jgi:hypothetical protein